MGTPLLVLMYWKKTDTHILCERNKFSLSAQSPGDPDSPPPTDKQLDVHDSYGLSASHESVINDFQTEHLTTFCLCFDSLGATWSQHQKHPKTEIGRAKPVHFLPRNEVFLCKKFDWIIPFLANALSQIPYLVGNPVCVHTEKDEQIWDALLDFRREALFFAIYERLTPHQPFFEIWVWMPLCPCQVDRLICVIYHALVSSEDWITHRYETR